MLLLHSVWTCSSANCHRERFESFRNLLSFTVRLWARRDLFNLHWLTLTYQPTTRLCHAAHVCTNMVSEWSQFYLYSLRQNSGTYFRKNRQYSYSLYSGSRLDYRGGRLRNDPYLEVSRVTWKNFSFFFFPSGTGFEFWWLGRCNANSEVTLVIQATK
jgi:hypothetical protein